MLGDRDGELDGDRDGELEAHQREERRRRQASRDVQGHPAAAAGRERPVEKVGGCRGRQRWPASKEIVGLALVTATEMED